MGTIAHFYNSSDEQSILSRAIGLAKYAGSNDITSYDTKGKNKSALDSLIATVSAGTCTRILVSNGTQATYSVAGKFIYDQIGTLDSLLKTANKGTSVRAGTCQSNSTVTNIVLDSGASAVDDYYKGMWIKTAGTTAVYRYITGYTGTSKIATCATTTTAISTTETFIVYTNAYIDLIGDAVSTTNICRSAWDTLFPTVVPPMIVQVMGGYNTGFAAYEVDGVTADSVTANTLVDATVFTASAEIGKWLGIPSGTTGGGEVQKILSNTTTTLTVTPFRITPTGTIKYQISETQEWCLANYYLPYAIKCYLQLDNAGTNKILKKMLDKYNLLTNSTTKNAIGDDELVLSYCQRGKSILDYASL